MKSLTTHSANPAIRALDAVASSGRFVLLALFSLVTLSQAGTLPPVTLAWNKNPEPDIAAYEINYGTTRGVYPNKIKVGKKTRYKVSGLKDNASYYFVIRAINKAGLRSQPSKVITYGANTALPNRAPNGKITAPESQTTVRAGNPVTFSSEATDPDGDKNVSFRWNFGKDSGIPDATAKNPEPVSFGKPGTYRVTLTVTDSKGLRDPSPASCIVRVLPALNFSDRSVWKLKYASSEQPGGFAASRAFDGKDNTFWLTETRSFYLPPHEIKLDLGSTRHVKGFHYLPRQDDNRTTDIRDYKFYVSLNGSDWGAPVAAGSFDSSATAKIANSTPKHGRFVRLVCTGGADAKSPVAIAEFNILERAAPNRIPKAVSRTVATTQNTSMPLTLAGSDADGNPLTYVILSRPKNGKLSGKAPRLTYTPAAGFTGTDRITYRAKDGISNSLTATIRIQVNAATATAKEALVEKPASSSVADATKTGAITGNITVDGKKYLTITIPKPAVPDGLIRRVEVSSNLVDWFSGKKHTTVISDNERFLKVRDNTPLTPGKKRHIRVRIVKS